MTDHPLAHATFHVMGDSVVPPFWTDYFGVKPDTAITRGVPFNTPSGRVSPMPGRVGLWGSSSKSAVHSDALDPHLRYLIKRLELTRPGLRDVLERESVKVRFWCYWYNESGKRVPHVADDIRALIESVGGAIEIDEYQ